MWDVLAKMRECGKEAKMRDFPHDCGTVDTYGFFVLPKQGEIDAHSPTHLETSSLVQLAVSSFKEALYRIWCGVYRLGDSGVNRLGDTSAFVNLAGQLLLTRCGVKSPVG